ncbi:MAG: hypothetical protein PHU34_09975 [Candidatus Methanoperedens sp.]|nr:hypothetical protein [Candidatus Methanoperedens sp.]
MKRTKQILIIVILILIALNIIYLAFNYSKEGNALTATNFVKNEATYKFDGIPETFELTEIKTPCPYCWEFIFEYQSRNSGYGDRQGLIVAPVITNHTAKIVIQKGTIQSAVLDNKWDMNLQKSIEPAEQQQPSPPRERKRID